MGLLKSMERIARKSHFAKPKGGVIIEMVKSIGKVPGFKILFHNLLYGRD